MVLTFSRNSWDVIPVETIFIPLDSPPIISSSSKGDQSKWRIGNKWVKQNSRGYENLSEYVASLILKSSTLASDEYVVYYPCKLLFPTCQTYFGCYSYDFRDKKQEVTLERLFEMNFQTTSDILSDNRLSTLDKFNIIVEKIKEFTNLDIKNSFARMLAFDALILNEDRHTNNILFLYDINSFTWQLAPLFDHGLSLLSDEKDYPQNIELDILIRQVKSKPFNTSFKKQLALHNGEPFIYLDKLKQELDNSSVELGRAKEVLLMQLEDPAFKKLLIVGE